MPEIKEILQNAGLTAPESSVYLAALKLGHPDISAIAKKAGVSRTNCYDILKRLSKLGLVRFYLKDNKKHIRVIHPEVFLDMFDKKEDQLQKSKAELEKILPQLNSFYDSENRAPKIFFFEGIKGFLDMYYFLYKDGSAPDEAYEFNAWNKDANQWFPEEREKHRKMRIKKKIKVNQLVVESPFTKEWVKPAVAKEEFKETRLIKGDIFDLGANVEIFKNKVVISNFGNQPEENQGVLIQSKEITSLLINIFKLAWQTTEKATTIKH